MMWLRRVHSVLWMVTAVRVVTAGIACLSNPCSHGICIDDINSTFSCYCVDGYTGVQCQTNWDECWSGPCLNGGTCIDGIASYNCSCPDGFIGDNCETNYNECESNPCLNNGTCIDLTNGYVCSCVPGYSGQHCELDIAVCNATEEVRCHNGGQCIEGPGYKFYCKCLPGWAGPKCEQQIDECDSNPCRNGGVCIDVHADYMCACAFGYTGKSCEIQIEFCDKDSCSNNALCLVEDGVRVCYCVPDFHGERCELQYDECLLGPRCMNGGTCIDGVDNFTCSCPPRLTGPLCECLILDETGTLDCEYVSPTPLPDTTESTLTTTQMYDSTTETSTTNSLNETSITTVMTSDVITFTSKPTTITEAVTLLTTEISADTVKTEATPMFETTTSTPLEITQTTETQVSNTGETIGSENSVTGPTTECKESCSTETNDKTSPETISTIESSKDTTTTQTSKPTESLPELTSSTKTVITESVTHEISPELTSTAITDITTDKMFTDSPTEQSITELPISPTVFTTDITEISTVFDNVTIQLTTIQSECHEATCNNHGNCVNTPHGIRCQCLFNYGGRFCEEKISVTSAAFGGNSYIIHHLKNSTSIDIEFNAKTLITDGQIMYVDIAKDVYMQLYMNSGLLKFKFSCGYQTMLLSELKTFVNKGYLMRIQTRLDLYLQEQQCNATLRLNDTVAMSGGQVANITAIDQNATLYLGNSPSIIEFNNKPFIGCIKDLIVYGEEREIFGEAFEASDVSECSSLSCLSGPCLNGGTCSDHGDRYTCSCANGWIGMYCNDSVCNHNPCQAGGSCVPHVGSGFLCLCPLGRHGIFCEYNVEITRPSLAPISSGISSYLMYPLSPSAINSERFDLRLRFQTADMDQIALLVFVGQNGQHDSRSQHLALTFVKGYIMLTWNMGSGPRRIFTSRPLSYRRGGHGVRVWRRGRSAGFSVDGRHNVTGNAPSHDATIALLPYVYIGGHPSVGFLKLPHDLPLHNGWRGCVWEVGGQAVAGGKPVGGRGVGQCGVAQCTAKSCNAPRGVCIHSPATYGCICNEGWFGPTCSSTKNPCDSSITECGGRCVVTAESKSQCDCPYGKSGTNCDHDLIPTDVLFTGLRSYIRLHPRTVSSVSLSLEAEIKPTKERGLVIFAETPNFYTAMSLQGGLLEYRWTDRLSGVTSLVRSGVVVSLSEWHSVKAGRYGSRLYVWVDGALATDAMLAHAYPHTATNASILLGGAEDLSTLPFEVMSGPPEAYTGCIRNFHVNNILLPLEQQNILSGQNVVDCDGTPCGGETCGSGSCAVEGGRAVCSCAGGVGGAGGRCRRQASCSPAHCRPPGGVCKAGNCVCATGYVGNDCEQKINITVPQFTGDSLISVWRRATLGRLDAIASPHPHYLTINFTSPELNQILIWISMESNYFGIGMENGYMKLVWFLANMTQESGDMLLKRTEGPRSMTRLVPQAGFLADAEWHTLTMSLDRNITLIIDKQLVFVEVFDLNGINHYNTMDLFIGGVNERDSPIAKKIFSSNFKGCIDNISTNNETFITNFTEMYSENIKSCQYFPLI